MHTLPTTPLPHKAQYVIIGAGIHGMSTALHLAKLLQEKGKDCNENILIIDKAKSVASGASGIACGVIRNNYFQPAMRKLMAHSVGVWESDPEAFSYYGNGYMQISCERMRKDVKQIYTEQKEIGYESEFIEGASESNDYMKKLFHDWQAQGITSVLHEKRGGFANSLKSMHGLADKALEAGVIFSMGNTVTGLEKNQNGVTAVITDNGRVECEHLIVASGPWVRDFWKMLEMPSTIDFKDLNGNLHVKTPMWTFWQLEEGELAFDPNSFTTNDGGIPPVIHVDTDAPLYSTQDKKLITDKMWGIYFKPDWIRNAIQGGASPYRIDKPADSIAIDPYGPLGSFVARPSFPEMWVSALAHCFKRFEGTLNNFRHEPSGGVGCMTADSFPIFDHFYNNVTIIADSNHGYKMLGIGLLIAKEILGSPQDLLKPFRFSRFEEGKLHPVSNSPYPWS